MSYVDDFARQCQHVMDAPMIPKDSHARLTTCACLLVSADALAQSATAEREVLEEVIVTVQRRSENLQDVPISVTQFTAEVRDLIGILDVEDLTNFTPGLTYSTIFDRASIRGIGRLTNALGTDPGVALYIDGFYAASATQAGRSTLFNERVEVLRGPQGTLYGRNAMGGAINTISRSPHDAFGAEIRSSVGDYDELNFEGTVTGPIADWLRFRASAANYRTGDGYYRNISGGPDEGGVRDDQDYEVSFSADLGEAVDVWAKWARQAVGPAFSQLGNICAVQDEQVHDRGGVHSARRPEFFCELCGDLVGSLVQHCAVGNAGVPEPGVATVPGPEPCPPGRSSRHQHEHAPGPDARSRQHGRQYTDVALALNRRSNGWAGGTSPSFGPLLTLTTARARATTMFRAVRPRRMSTTE